MNRAKTLIRYKAFTFIKEWGGYSADSESADDYLYHYCEFTMKTCNQNTWVFSDNSYITENEELFFCGDDYECFDPTGD